MRGNVKWKNEQKSAQFLRCGPTKKVCFKTAEAANVRAARILSEPDCSVRAFRVYLCYYCSQWHLSSK
jgi:hypothetical protein